MAGPLDSGMFERVPTDVSDWYGSVLLVAIGECYEMPNC